MGKGTGNASKNRGRYVAPCFSATPPGNRSRLALLFLLLSPLYSIAQNASLALEPRRIEPGDTAVLSIMVSGAPAQPEGVDFGAWDSLVPQENILSRSGWQRSGSVWVYKCTLTAFDSLVVQMPPLRVRLHLGNTLETNSVQWQVIPKAVSRDVNGMAPVRDIRREQVFWYDYWPWALGACALLGLVFWQIRRRRKRKPVIVPIAAPAPPPRETPAHEQALAQLDALAREQLWKKGELKTHYVRLSLLLREYLEKRYRVPALESTTREILPALKNAGFPLQLQTSLRELLEQADLTKYARTPPPPEYHEKSLRDARQLIQQTQVQQP